MNSYSYRKLKSVFTCANFIRLLLFISLSATNVFSKSTNIVFEDKVYKNVLLAINGDVDVNTCNRLLEDLKKTIDSFSSKLNITTNGRAALGSVDVLFPNEWSLTDIRSNCNNPLVQPADVFQNYEHSDIKVTNNHPIAKSLPWTRQYGGCGQEAESIYIPPLFLTSSKFDDNIRGNFLLHEWAKFRYGVFEEFGYFNDNIFPPCYMHGGKANFSSCSDVTLPSIGEGSLSGDECKDLINANENKLKAELAKGYSSIMSSPHLPNVNRFCTLANHNRLAPTKHNFMCNRKSVSDVLFSHRDFLNAHIDEKFFQSAVNITYIHGWQDTDRKEGFAFIIEDSFEIRNNGGLKAMKQAIAQMVNMMAISTEVMVLRFNGDIYEDNLRFTVLSDDASKGRFIGYLPDQESLPLTLKNHQQAQEMRISGILKKVIPALRVRQTFKYKIIVLGSQPPIGTDEAIEYAASETVPLSFLTYDTLSLEWLKWNTIRNTEKVLYIPPCERNPCSGKLVSLLTDSLLEILGNSRPRRYFNKIFEQSISSAGYLNFQITDNISRFVASLPTYVNITEFPSFVSPSNGSCLSGAMLGYGNVIYIDNNRDCAFESGTWSVNIANPTLFHFLQVYGEMREGGDRLVITTSLGHSLEKVLLPTQSTVPVYAKVSSHLEQPIINASVNLELFISDAKKSTLPLLDNGQYPDMTKNDGVYTALLQNYSPTPATHLGQIIVKSTSNTRKVVELNTVGNAALLDTELSTKCCGNEVPLNIDLVESFGNTFYSSFIPSFKTNETFTSIELPPSKIQSISFVSEGSGPTVFLMFASPGIVSRYDICCFKDKEDAICTPIPPENCSPMETGNFEGCLLQKTLLQEAYNTNELIYCGIRGVSSKNIAGEISGTIVEIDVRNTGPGSTDPSVNPDDSTKCESLSDGCLPLYVFWILIGCVGALLLTILIGLICICQSRRSQKQKDKHGPHNKNITGKYPDKDSPLYNVYVNQAYIQDSDGQLKLVATDGELLPYDTNVNERTDDQGYATQNSVPHTPVPTNHGFPPTAVRRRSISANAAERDNFSSFKQPDPNDNRKHVSWTGDHDNNTPSTGTNRNRNYGSDYPVPDYNDNGQNMPTGHEPNLSRGISKSEEFIALPLPKPKDRFPKPAVGYANPTNPRSLRSEGTTMTPVPSVSSTLEANSRNNFLNSNLDDENDGGPIYASVSRNGHRPFSTTSNQSGGPPPYNPFGLGSHIVPTSNPSIPSKSKNINTKSNHGLIPTRENPAAVENPFGAGRFSRGGNNPNRKSVRLDAFPSSESETYSDISRGVSIPPAPPLPPPFPSTNNPSRYSAPKTSSAPINVARRTNGDGSDRIDRGTLQQPPSTTNTMPVSRSPPSDNSFAGIRSHIEQHMKNKTFNRPPPPPRHDKLPLSSVASNASSFGSRVAEMGEVNPQEDYDEDEGSDFWDDGEDFEDFNPGHSYA